MTRLTGRSHLFEQLREAIKEQLPFAVDLRHKLHAQPGISGQEGPASQVIAEAIGLPTVPVAGTGFITRIGPQAGPAVAIRAELDALPITEKTSVPWASRNGAMHACGHDVHQAALVALARAAKCLDLPAAIVPILQPREETYPSGAADIIGSGVLEAQSVQAVLAVHVQPKVPHGSVSTGIGPINAAADEFRITVNGHGGHGAYPHSTVDPVPIIARITLGLHELIGRAVNPMNPSVLTIGSVTAGDAANVIPDSAALSGTLRTMNKPDQERLHILIREFAEHTAFASGAVAEVAITRGEPVLHNDASLVVEADPWIAEAGFTLMEPLRSLGADDFSFYTEKVPGIMAFLGVKTLESSVRPRLHHSQFLPTDAAVGEAALVLAASYVGALGLDPFRYEPASRPSSLATRV